jgi:hypothetical protein
MLFLRNDSRILSVLEFRNGKLLYHVTIVKYFKKSVTYFVLSFRTAYRDKWLFQIQFDLKRDTISVEKDLKIKISFHLIHMRHFSILS